MNGRVINPRADGITADRASNNLNDEIDQHVRHSRSSFAPAQARSGVEGQCLFYYTFSGHSPRLLCLLIGRRPDHLSKQAGIQIIE